MDEWVEGRVRRVPSPIVRQSKYRTYGEMVMLKNRRREER